MKLRAFLAMYVLCLYEWSIYINQLFGYYINLLISSKTFHYRAFVLLLTIFEQNRRSIYCSFFTIKAISILKRSMGDVAFDRLVLLLLILANSVEAIDDDYHPSSSPAFDEGNLASISRFYPIGIF